MSGSKLRDGGVLLHRQVRVAFVEESVFANQIGLGEAFFDVAEFQRDFLVNVAAVAVFVNARLVDQNRFFDRGDRVERFVLDFDQIHRVEGDVFIDRRDGRHRIADEAHLVDAERVFILADRKNAVGDRQVFAGDDRKHAGQRQRFRNVDALDQRVRQMAAQDFAEEHARQHDVVGKLRLAGALRARIDLAKRLADYVQRLPVVVTVLSHINSELSHGLTRIDTDSNKNCELHSSEFAYPRKSALICG